MLLSLLLPVLADATVAPVGTSCPKGRYMTNSFQSCARCPAGKYGVDERVCRDCPIGRWQNTPGKASCGGCPVGRFGVLAAHADCFHCPEGKHQDKRGQDYCDEPSQKHP